MSPAFEEQKAPEAAESEEFGELLKHTAAGYDGGLLAGFVLDQLGFQRSALGQWLVRTLSGEGESIFDSSWTVKRPCERRSWPISMIWSCCFCLIGENVVVK